mmetsp:Transcript_52969/g.124065  ORF Transcript_52969/g.124065 Transcript_52969/m.124065 type:complete len:914 (+) Transcript_52969:62-2803(+)
MWYGRHCRAPGYRPGITNSIGRIPTAYDKEKPVRPERQLPAGLLETLAWTDAAEQMLQGGEHSFEGEGVLKALPALKSTYSSNQLLPVHVAKGAPMEWTIDGPTPCRQMLPPLANAPHQPEQASAVKEPTSTPLQVGSSATESSARPAQDNEEAGSANADLDKADSSDTEDEEVRPQKSRPLALDELGEPAVAVEGQPKPRRLKNYVLRSNTLTSILSEAGLEVAGDNERKQQQSMNLLGRNGRLPDFELSSDEKINTVFHDIGALNDGAITVGANLTEALLELGYPYPWSDWIHEILEDECEGREGLDADDFKTLVKSYEERLKDFLQDIFYTVCSEDQTIEVVELPQMIVRAGVLLMADAGEELRSAVSNIAGESASISLRAFVRIFRELSYGAGLTNGEVERRTEEFEERADYDGCISVDQLRRLMKWHESLVNLAGGPTAVHRLVDDVIWRTHEGKMSLEINRLPPRHSIAHDEETAKHALTTRITRFGYFAACRQFHEKIAEGLSNLLSRTGISMSTPIRESTLVPVLEEIGYLAAMPGNVRHFIERCGYDVLSELRFEHIYSVIFHFCENNGFTDIERKIIDDSFTKFDQDFSGTLETDELGPVIRWLGYQPSQYRMYDFAESVGLAEGSFFNITEFKHLVAEYMKVSLQGVRALFGGREDRLPNTRIGEMLQMVGYDPTEQEVARLIERAGGYNETLNFREFKLLEVSHRAHVRKVMAQNDGFTDADLQKYRKYFHENVPEGSDCIAQKAMRNILAALFPDTGQSQERHKKITKMVKDADADGNGQFSFEEYCMLMKNITEEIDRDMLVKGLRLKKDLGYSKEEVKQFRDLFNMYDKERNGEIQFEDLANIFTTIVDMTNESRRDLRALVESDSHERLAGLNFWQFLVLMHKVQKMNWHGINELIG